MNAWWSRIQKWNSRHPWPAFVVGVALLVVVVVHGTSTHYTFVSDDYDWLTQAEQNIAAHQVLKPLWSPIGGNFYRPLPALSLTLDTWLAGRNAAIFHAHQVFCFFLLVLAIAWFIETLTQRRRFAFAAAALFAVYPAHHEVVSWLAGRPDLLATLWLVVSAGAVAKYVRNPKWYWLAAICVSTALALLSKESALVAPGIHLLVLVVHKFLHRETSRQRLLITLAPSILLVAAVLFIRSHVLTDAIGGYLSGGEQVGLHIQFRDLFAPITSALALINLDYLRAVTGLSIGASFIRVGALLLAGVVIVLSWRSWKVREQHWIVGFIAFGAAWTLISFIPALGLSSAIGSNLEGSRLFFGPSIGYCIVWVALVTLIFRSPRWRRVGYVGLVTVFAILSAFNGAPWAQASKEVVAIRDALNKNYTTLAPNGTTDVIVGGLPSKVYGAYAYWGPHITRAVVQTAAKHDVNVISIGVTAYDSSPFCDKGTSRHVVYLRWNDTEQHWTTQSDIITRLTKAGREGKPLTFVPGAANWTTTGLTSTNFDTATDYTIQGSTSAINLLLPNSTIGATYRAIRITLAAPLSTTGFNAHRFLLWWTRPADNSVQTISATIPQDALTFTIPLCQYPNWPMTEGLHGVSFRIGDTGSFAPKYVEFLTHE